MFIFLGLRLRLGLYLRRELHGGLPGRGHRLGLLLSPGAGGPAVGHRDAFAALGHHGESSTKLGALDLIWPHGRAGS